MKKLLLTFLLLGSISFCFADEMLSENTKKLLTVEDAVNLALENNLKIKQSQMDLDVLALKDKYSWNSISPRLSLSASPSGNNSFDFKNSDNNVTSLNWSITGSLSMTYTPALATSIKAAKLAYELGEISLEDTKRQIELNVRKSFYSLIYFNENLDLQMRSLETAKQTYESNQKKYNQGRLSELNLLTSQVNYEKMKPGIENLKTTFNTSLTTFKQTLGIPLEEEIELTGTLEDAFNVELDESVLNINIDELSSIKTLKKNIESLENSLQATKYSAYGPSVSLSISDGISQSNSRVLNRVTGDKEWSKGNVSDRLSYSLSVNIPLDGYFPWSSGKINLESQDVNIKKLNQNLEQAKTSAKLAINDSYNKILQAKTQLSLYEKSVNLMEKTYEMNLKAYNMGSSDLLSLQTAEDNLMQAKYSVTNQKYQIISSILDLENALGIEFGTLTQNKKAE